VVFDQVTLTTEPIESTKKSHFSVRWVFSVAIAARRLDHRFRVHQEELFLGVLGVLG
jgi:hypothetical protein